MVRVPTLSSGAVAACGLLILASVASAQGHRTVPPPARDAADGQGDAREILQRYMDAWRGPDEMTLADTLVVGFRFSGPGGGDYHGVFPPDGDAELAPGVPEMAFVFHGDMEILRRLDRGELSAMTAMGRASMSDPAPLDVALPPGTAWTTELQATLLPFTFHFWNRSWPEITRFGDGTTRVVHGGAAAILYYDRALRTAFYQLEPGMHVNEEASQQTNPFPSLFVVIHGEIEARLDGLPRTLRQGEAVLVPVGMTHEFWVRSGQYGELIMIAFGEGA